MAFEKQGLTTLPRGWKEAISELYEAGCSDAEIIRWIRKARGTFSMGLWHRWLEEERIFRDVIEMGQMSSLAWWEEQARTQLNSKAFQTALWTRVMVNRFKWQDMASNVHLYNSPQQDLTNKTPQQLLDMLNDKIQVARERSKKTKED